MIVCLKMKKLAQMKLSRDNCIYDKSFNEGRIDTLKSCMDDIDRIIDECNNKNRED